MYRRLVFTAVILGTASACTVQPTPREYIDRQIPVDEVRLQAEHALRDRITALMQALQAGNVAAAEAALAPAAEVVIIGPGEGERLAGPAQVTAILDLLAAGGGARPELIDLQTHVGPRATTGWFFARLEVRSPGSEQPVPVRVTGLYLTREGTWELQHAHFSIPSAVLTSPARAESLSPAEAG